MPEPVPPCPDKHCCHPTTTYPAPGLKRVDEQCCNCPTVTTFWWALEPKAGHGPYADVREWVKVPDPIDASTPIVFTDLRGTPDA